MMDIEQAEIDFGSPAGDGYAMWQWDQAEAIKKIAKVWALPLNQRFRLKLVNIDSEFEGFLSLAERPITLDRRKPLVLRLKPLKFCSDEIEHCVVIE